MRVLDSSLELFGDLVVKAFPWHKAPRHILVLRRPTLINTYMVLAKAVMNTVDDG